MKVECRNRGPAPRPGLAAPALALALLGLAVALGTLGAPGPAGAGCTNLGGSVVCDGDVSNTQVGHTVVFPRGPAGERVGDYVVRPKGGLPQVLSKESETAPPGPRPLDRPDRLTDPTRGRDFGAFEFRSAPPAGLSATGPLR